MNKLSEHDIQLLYKSIVLIEEPETAEKAVAPAKQITEATAEAPIVEEVKQAPLAEPKEKSPAPIVNPYANFEFALITPKEIKINLLRSGSNCDKIANALHISHLFQSHISMEELKDVSQLAHCRAIWGIGLTADEQTFINNLSIPKLFSPNPEVLQSAEDKRAMFEPLKAFAPSLKAT